MNLVPFFSNLPSQYDNHFYLTAKGAALSPPQNSCWSPYCSLVWHLPPPSWPLLMLIYVFPVGSSIKFSRHREQAGLLCASLAYLVIYCV